LQGSREAFLSRQRVALAATQGMHFPVIIGSGAERADTLLDCGLLADVCAAALAGIWVALAVGILRKVAGVRRENDPVAQVARYRSEERRVGNGSGCRAVRWTVESSGIKFRHERLKF